MTIIALQWQNEKDRINLAMRKYPRLNRQIELIRNKGNFVYGYKFLEGTLQKG